MTTSFAPETHQHSHLAMETRLLAEHHEETGAVVQPIYRTSTYRLMDPTRPFENPYVYARFTNPNMKAFEEKLAILEGGARGYSFVSGMAAVTTALMAMLQPGDHIVAQQVIYGGTYTFLNTVLPRDWNVHTSFVDLTNPDALDSAITDKTKILYLESPTNPNMVVLDMPRLIEKAHARGLKVVVDNTFMTPLLQRPLDLGADVVVHSLTKYVGGHSTALGGAIVVRDAKAMHQTPTGERPLWEQILQYQHLLGGVMTPEVCWEMTQHLKTLPLRMAKHCENAMAVAQYLEQHPAIERVIYPGLPSHPQAASCQAQFKNGFGGMLSFVVRGGRPAIEQFFRQVPAPLTVAVSLGGVESLVFPAWALFQSQPVDVREAIGIPEGMIRYSVGIEALEDIKAALDKGLAGL